MPTIIRWKGYIFRFYSVDGSEPPHIHVRRDRKEAKFWLLSLEMAYNIGYRDHEITEIHGKLVEAQNELLEAWNGFFE